MDSVNQTSKICPSCRALIPIDRLKMITSRSRGRVTKTLRCHRCIEKIALANKTRK